MVATAPLPLVESCSARVAGSLGWRLSVLSRSGDKVELRPVASGMVAEQSTSSSGTTGYKRPLFDGRKVIGTEVVNTDRSGDLVRAPDKRLSPLTLKPTGTGETTLETKSYNVTPYREIAERCAAPPDSASD